MISKYAYLRVLCFFLKNPTKEVYIKELSRILKISSQTSKNSLDTFHKKKILNLDKKGRTHFYKLENDSYFVRHLKTTYILSKMNSISFEFTEEIISVAIYGSYASGEFDEKSDFDLLIISSEKKDYPQIYKKIEDNFHVSVSPLVLTPFEWQEISQGNEEFYIEVIKDHILVFGSELIV